MRDEKCFNEALSPASTGRRTQEVRQAEPGPELCSYLVTPQSPGPPHLTPAGHRALVTILGHETVPELITPTSKTVLNMYTIHCIDFVWRRLVK